MRRPLHPELGIAILRVVLGVTFVAHGAPKLVGGVGGFAGFLEQLGFGFPGPVFWAWVATCLEFFGGLCLIAGFLVPPVALLLCVEMALGIVLVHASHGWYVVGPGQNGVEFSVLLIASLLALVLGGPGVAAVDRLRGREREVLRPEGVEIAEPPELPETGEDG